MVIDKGAKTLKLYSLSTSQGGTQMLQTTNLWSFPMCQAKRSATLNFYADTLTIFFIIIGLPLLLRNAEKLTESLSSDLNTTSLPLEVQRG